MELDSFDQCLPCGKTDEARHGQTRTRLPVALPGKVSAPRMAAADPPADQGIGKLRLELLAMTRWANVTFAERLLFRVEADTREFLSSFCTSLTEDLLRFLDGRLLLGRQVLPALCRDKHLLLLRQRRQVEK
jgi:hypothetical protein